MYVYIHISIIYITIYILISDKYIDNSEIFILEVGVSQLFSTFDFKKTFFFLLFLVTKTPREIPSAPPLAAAWKTWSPEALTSGRNRSWWIQRTCLAQEFPISWKQHKQLPSRELTYPTLGKGKSSSNMPFWGDMLVPIWVFPKIGGKTPKWMVKIMGKPL